MLIEDMVRELHCLRAEANERAAAADQAEWKMKAMRDLIITLAMEKAPGQVTPGVIKASHTNDDGSLGWHVTIAPDLSEFVQL